MKRLPFAVLLAALIATTAVLGQSVPRNASPRPAGGGWACNDGFIKRASACVTLGQATDAEIKDHLVTKSIEGYAGSCPCPYNSDRAGRRCGARSAYSRPGGAAPLCFATDVTQKMVDDYGKRK